MYRSPLLCLFVGGFTSTGWRSICLPFSAADHGEEHLEAFRSMECMADVGRHDDGPAGFEEKRLASDSYFHFPFQYLYEGIERCCVFAQSLPLVEGEESNVAYFVLKYLFADDSAVGILY